jgi:hypothetical protein
MKKQLIFGCIFVTAMAMNAQWTPSGSNVYKTVNGNVGINKTSPTYSLDIITTAHDEGIQITNGQENGTRGNLGLHLNNVSVGGHKWSLFSLGKDDPWGGAGNLAIYDHASPSGSLPRLFISGGVGFNAPAGNIGIGTVTPSGKLHVNSIITPLGQGIEYSSILGTINSSSLVPSAGGVHTIVGVKGLATGFPYFGGSQVNEFTIGVYGRALNGIGNIGGQFIASGNGLNANYGIYAAASGNSNPSLNIAGYFAGNVYGNAFYIISDQKLKDNIRPLGGALDNIMKLKPSTYAYKSNDEAFKGMHLPEGNQIGLIAQDLEKVFPSLVIDMKGTKQLDADGKGIDIADHKVVNYIHLIPVLIAGIQEQQKQIESQQQLINQLLQKTSSVSGIDQTRLGSEGFVMEQNIPNPFNGETTIKYNLPESVNNAYVAIYDLSGKQIASFPLKDKVSKSITITSEKLVAGIYIYSIVADSKIIDSKRMNVSEK